MSATPFDSVAVILTWYTPSASGGAYANRNSFHADGLAGSVVRTLMAVLFTTTAPDGDVRLSRAPLISELPNGSETFAWTTNASLGDHTPVGAFPSRRSRRSIRTYVVVSASSRDEANVEFIARIRSTSLEGMSRTVSRMRPPDGNAWAIGGSAKANPSSCD